MTEKPENIDTPGDKFTEERIEAVCAEFSFTDPRALKSLEKKAARLILQARAERDEANASALYAWEKHGAKLAAERDAALAENANLKDIAMARLLGDKRLKEYFLDRIRERIAELEAENAQLRQEMQHVLCEAYVPGRITENERLRVAFMQSEVRQMSAEDLIGYLCAAMKGQSNDNAQA